MSERSDLLDRLARRFVKDDRPIQHAKSVVATGDHSEGGAALADRFSRASALKVGILGVLSVSMGLWTSPAAQGQSMGRGECIDGCEDSAQKLLNRLLQSCEDIFQPQAGYERRWRQLRTLFRYGFFSFFWDAAAATLAEKCYSDMRSDIKGKLDKCVEECRKKCPPRRSLQSALSPQQGKCEYTPPAKPSPPQIPPAPAPEDVPCPYCTARCDPCNAVESGGVCCLEINPIGACCPGG